jgi:phosphoribosylanthranilate isomerase
MKNTRIKICGITLKDQAEEISSLNVDALGFILYPKSPRYVSPDKVKSLLSDLPPFLKTIGVFVNDPLDKIIEIIRMTGLDMAQLSGDETPDFCSGLSEYGISWMKAVRVKNQESLNCLRSYMGGPILLDAWSDNAFGGTGKSFDWNALAGDLDMSRMVLAGGITPENAGEAIRIADPYAIDVSSGVEIEPGIKSMDRVRQLIKTVESVYNSS